MTPNQGPLNFLKVDCNELTDPQNNRYHPITKECMLGLITNYLIHDKTIAYSGYLDLSKASSLIDFEGMKFYFCYNGTDMFLAYNNLYKVFALDDPDCTVDDEELYQASELHKYIPSSISTDKILDDLTAIKVNFDANQTLSTSDVNSFIGQFKSKDPLPEEYKACAIFKKDEMDRLWKQDGIEMKGIYYMLGYDQNFTHKYRIILIAVDQSGKLYLKNSAGSEVVYLEHAFPPN